MKTIIRSVCLLLLLLGLASALTACVTPSVGEEEGIETASSTELPNAADDGYRLKLQYYEEQNRKLQEEILSLKTQLYTQRVEYESKLEAMAGASAGDESDFLYALREGLATVTGYIGHAKEVVIPASLGGCPVVAIADSAFADNTTLLSVVVPEGVTTVGWFAFSGCIALQSVTLSADVTAIGYGAFDRCPAALTVIAPAGSYAQSYAASYGIGTK